MIHEEKTIEKSGDIPKSENETTIIYIMEKLKEESKSLSNSREAFSNFDKDFEIKKLEFEKCKYKLQLWKWLIGTFGIAIITMIIDYGFRERAATLNELQFYDKYVTDLIVLNNKVGPRRLLAQYFANITVSEKLKKGWVSYYNIVDEEYKNILKKDSVLEKRIIELKNDSLRSETNELNELKHQREIIKEEIHSKVKLVPDSYWYEMKDQIIEAENYYKSGSTFGKEQSLKIYHDISQNLSEIQKLTLSENKRALLKKADESYENNYIEDALDKYYFVFKDK